MAPYLRHINSDRSELLESLEEKNKKEIEGIDTKLKEAEESLGESEISELLRKKAMYYCRIGDKVGQAGRGPAGPTELIPTGTSRSSS